MLRNMTLLLFTVGLLAATSCAGALSKKDLSAVTAQPAPFHHDPDRTYIEVRDPTSGAGLWQDISARNLFQDMRAHKVGDLVTVNIVETSKASKKASTQTGRESSVDAGIDNLLGWEGRLKNLTSFGKPDVRSAYDNTTMFKGSMKNNFTGSGSTSRDESMTASITARVMDVKANGNLFIKGTREIKVNNETQFIILSGLIRPADISPDNTVLSSYIGDASIEYIGTGSVSDKQRPGWLARVVDFAWPF